MRGVDDSTKNVEKFVFLYCSKKRRERVCGFDIVTKIEKHQFVSKVCLFSKKEAAATTTTTFPVADFFKRLMTET